MDDDVRLAEQALVAGLTLAPEGLPRLVSWLSASDFASPACGLVFSHLLSLHRCARPVTPTSLLEALRARDELRGDGYPVSGLVRWLDRAPAPALLPAYARLTLEAAACRQVEATGVRLVQLAGGPEPARALLGAAGRRTGLVEQLRRLQSMPFGDVPPAPSRGSGVAWNGSVASGADAARRAETDPDLTYAELVTVGSVVLAPASMRRLGRWLQAEDFAAADCGVVFGRVAAMVRDGSPVDRMTVRAELRRRGELDDAHAANVLARAEAAVPVPACAPFYARRVLAASVSRRVMTVGESLVRLGRDRRGDGVAVVTAALAGLDGLGELLRRVCRSRDATGGAAISEVRGPERVGRRALSPSMDRG